VKRLVLLLVFSLACTTTTPAPAPVATTTPAADCNPGHAIVNATLWMQTSAEYRAAALGTYAAARRQLDAALADPSWSAMGQTSASALPPAIILDLDETAIDNTPFEARSIRKGTTFDTPSWQAWVKESNAAAVPGAADFLAYAQSRGVTPYYITNRDFDPEHPPTLLNLQKLRFPASDETLLTRGKQTAWRSDKTSRREYVAAKHRVLLLIGDDLNDFVDAREKTLAQRDAILEGSATNWGTRWFMVPNPIYGSWERAVSEGKSGCEQLQKKIDALHP
jgi:5'-nucleotidase (lipoprotein e(P4) family)